MDGAHQEKEEQSKKNGDNNKENRNGLPSVIDLATEEKIAEQEILREALEEKKRQSEDYYQQMLRLRAEFENFRKRSEKEKREYYQCGKEEVVCRLIDFLDVLEQAEKQITQSSDLNAIVTGFKLLRKDLNNFLQQEGVAAIGSVGERFNPACHEAMEVVETSDEGMADSSIIAEFQRGYRMGDRVLRPAKVKVCRHKPGGEVNRNNNPEGV